MGMRLPVRQQRETERGAISVFLVAAVTIVVIVALLLLVPFGSAALDRRTASTGADAAALGAAAQWADGLEETHQLLLGSQTESEFWGLLGRPLGSYRKTGMQDEARRFAASNDSDLVEYSVDGARGRVSVRVRSAEPAAGTSQYAYSDAVAELVLESGLCLAGDRLGVRIEGSCVSSPPEPEPEPEPSSPPPVDEDDDDDDDTLEPEPEPTPTFDLPSEIEARLEVRTRLVAG